MPEENLIQFINNGNIFICLSPTLHDQPLTDLSHQSILLHRKVINVVILPKSLKLKSINSVFNYRMNRGLEACFIVITLINSRINIINLERERHFPTRHDQNQFLSFFFKSFVYIEVTKTKKNILQGMTTFIPRHKLIVLVWVIKQMGMSKYTFR